MEKRIRLNLDLPVKVRERLDELRRISEADSLTEVVRRSLAVYDLLLHHRRKEKRGAIILRYDDGREERLRIL